MDRGTKVLAHSGVAAQLSSPRHCFCQARPQAGRNSSRLVSPEFESFLLQGITPHRSERLAVQRRWTVLQQSRQMLWRAVAFVRSQAVLGEDRIPLAHHAVALDLGQNG